MQTFKNCFYLLSALLAFVVVMMLVIYAIALAVG
jgi:hypothetical protein